MQNNIPDSHIHDGHRSRMRSKLLCYGSRIFDTYELLEMLLYHTVPLKDTNPIAKRLLYTFGGLDGVLSADRGRLTEVNGIGDKSAEFLSDVGELSNIIGAEAIPFENNVFADFNDAGMFFVDYFRDVKEKRVTVAYLDNNLDLIALEDVAKGMDFESGAIQPKIFIDGAVKHRASVLIVAHNHPYGAGVASPGDRETHKMLTRALELIRVSVAEHYVIAGDRFDSAQLEPVITFRQSPKLDSFIRARSESRASGAFRETLDRLADRYNRNDCRNFSKLLSYADKNSEQTALKLLRRFHTVESVFSASYDEIKTYAGEAPAAYLKLLAYIISRRTTDKFVLGQAYTRFEISEYLKDLYLGASDEEVYVLCLDSKNRFTGAELVSVGTVNSSDVVPRKIIEAAMKRSARSVWIAHNHPAGNETPSGDDLTFTSSIGEILRNAGISLLGHFVVAGRKCTLLGYEDMKITKL